ncbi:MFS transporter [Virgibacillus sp. M23]|uniref:MFS transporter n=1 Tax=Virgibacillus sp. M23 TaxID=3079030 RepID=UPI002A91AD1F|nr:MFS transporter [Virgibacillus sp. M23]MDY7043578.1 MFS transporter [Virgibacillus sp. M23]
MSATQDTYYKYRWWALGIVLLPTLLISLNNYMLQIALPSIQIDLHLSFTTAQILFSCYAIGLAVLLIVGGKLGDMYGRRKTLWFGVALFILSSLIGGLTSITTLLIGMRLVQGIAAAIIQPQILAIIQVIFPSHEQKVAFSLYGAVIGIAFAFGLILGGLIIDWNLWGLTWRNVFFLNIPFGILVLVLLPLIPKDSHMLKVKIDWIGTALLMSSILLAIATLTNSQNHGFSILTISILILTIMSTLLFIKVEKKQKHPLIDLNIFTNKRFSLGIISLVNIYLSMFALFFILSYYAQNFLGYDAKATSIIYLPIGLGFFISSLLAARITQFLRDLILCYGALIMSICIASLAILLYFAWTLQDALVIIILFIYGLSLGLATTPLASIILNGLPLKIVGVASGIFNTAMYLANSFAVAFISILFSSFMLPSTAFLMCLISISIASLIAAALFYYYQKTLHTQQNC